MKQNILQILLWISVIAWSLWFGGLMYELFVITPLWSLALPESAIEWNSRPKFMVIPTPFYAPVAVTTILSSLLGMFSGWKSGNRRIWLILSTVCAIATLAFTLVYFFPKNEVLFQNQIAGLSGEEITAIGNAWIRANYIRVGVMVVGFYAALKAFSLPKTD
ncbi:hypothetical protein BH10ACI1_BH10ACI1_15660 [soil metagenome]